MSIFRRVLFLGTPCLSDVKERMRQFCEKREGVVFISVPWCENFSFQLEKIYARLKIVAKETTRGILTGYITSMTDIFTSHEDCRSPRIILIEGEPGTGKTTYCQKLTYDWATKQEHRWHKSFPKIEVLLLLSYCRDIHDSIWDSIDDQIIKNLEETNPQTKDMFFKFMQDNPSKVMLVLDDTDEADPHKLEFTWVWLKKNNCLAVTLFLHLAIRSREQSSAVCRHTVRDSRIYETRRWAFYKKIF